MKTISVTMQLFGAFKKYGEKIIFIVPSGSTVQDVKNKLAIELKLDDPTLIYDSAIANDDEIIEKNNVFTQDCCLAILPPVCGG